MTPVKLEPAAPRSRVKHSTTEPLGSPVTFDLLFLEIMFLIFKNTVILLKFGYTFCQFCTP